MVDRFFVDLVSIPQSTVFLRLLKPCTVLAVYTAILVVLPTAVADACAYFKVTNPFRGIAMSSLTLPASAHSLLGTLCGLVLVFRTNSSYGRFVEGRTAWGALIRHVRDVARLSLYIPNKRLRRRLLELCMAYAYVLKTRLRSGRTRSDPNDPTAFRDNPEEAIRRCVSDRALADEILASQSTGNRCLYTLMLISKTLKVALEKGTPREVHWNIEESVSGMGLSGGICERIIATPIPLSFSRHTARSLVLWLLTLPFVLVPTMGWLSVPTIFTLAYLVLGIDEIGIQIEEPFATLPLTPLCATIERDMTIAITDIDTPEPGFALDWEEGGTVASPVAR
jgi:predicted membrane chloride channel (bestrophin family)